MVDRELDLLVDEALARLQGALEEASPHMAEQVCGWIEELAQGTPVAYFTQPRSFPMLLFPWWLEKTLHGRPDVAFQGDLVYSTVNGYYFVRLIDNLMDGHATVELQLLPALGFFHTQFHAPYQRYFAQGHPFWNRFQSSWFRSAAATMEDAQLQDLDRQQFEQIAARKTCAAEIPVAAVCYRYGRQDLLAPWSRLVQLFGCWHQMWNDVFGWLRDTRHGTRTYFLSEADRQRASTESATEWALRGGLDWGMALLQSWMDEMKAAAKELGCEDAVGYLQRREAMLRKRRESLSGGLQSAVALLDRVSGM